MFSPHPDDAVLAAGGLIQRVVHRGGTVQIVEMTSGDAFAKGVRAVRPAESPSADTYRWYGALREEEVVHAMHHLGVGRSRIRLLGFPDDGLCELAADRIPSTVFASPYTRRDSPPTAEQVLPGAKYRTADLRNELEQVLFALRPTLLVLPDPRDEHPDHCATHMLVHEALDRAVAAGLRRPRIIHYLTHYPGWPENAGRGEPGQAGDVETLLLTAVERARKLHAIEAYRSQMTVMARFLRAFDREEERFFAADREVPSPCWCHGDNIAGRGRAQ